ncbi:5-oxoprolinase subunit PxpA [Terasakiella sp. SH-1]|uniref:LamB/YcsF family protein n=1 Tax=Terasakiella sp. SH-1 TaxID=2560057 RepID=UPI0010733518|nr:5-oxoprolinase subunit PxpA [Terasakiella sp. SH-1]
MKQINLNADMGESFGRYQMGDDVQLMTSISSANIACGFHGGDPLVMQKTVKLAVDTGVSLGAHPSFPDLQGFGRRMMRLSQDELYSTMVYQIGALQAFAHAQGAKVTHVKPHGALNNMACEEAEMAQTLAHAVKDVDAGLIFLAPALSCLSSEAKKVGLRVAEEIFADRAYTEKGTLVNRQKDGAVIHDGQACLERILLMLDKGGIVSQSGVLLPCEIHSICVHGDTAHACRVAQTIRKGLTDHGYQLCPLPDMV